MREANGKPVPVIADGGIRCSGDVVKVYLETKEAKRIFDKKKLILKVFCCWSIVCYAWINVGWYSRECWPCC